MRQGDAFRPLLSHGELWTLAGHLAGHLGHLGRGRGAVAILLERGVAMAGASARAKSSNWNWNLAAPCQLQLEYVRSKYAKII